MKIELFPSNKVFHGEGDKTILESAIANNISLEHSCKTGQCGVCKAKLLSGEIEIQEGLVCDFMEPSEILTCCAVPKSDITIECRYVSELEGIKTQTLPAKVDSFSYLAEDVIEVYFRFPLTAKFGYLSGQYIDLIWNGKKRSYSIATSEGGKRIAIQVKRVNGGAFSKMFFGELEVNQLFRVSGPLGSFFCRDNSLDKVFICTGTGFAPVKSMVENLIAKNSGCNVYIFWGARTPEELYSDIPVKWGEQYENIYYQSVFSRSVGDVGDFYGYVQDAVVASGINLKEVDVYACGSSNMIASAKKLLLENGLNINNFYSDAFLASY